MANHIPKNIDALIDEHTNHFMSVIGAESDPTIILLKGHLFIEYYIDHLLILIFDKKINLEDLSFYEKIKKLRESDCLADESSYRCLKNLNRVRNNLAHQLSFKINKSDIDSVGFPLGKEYINIKFSEPGITESKLLFKAIGIISRKIFVPLYIKIFSASPVKNNNQPSFQLPEKAPDDNKK